MKLHDKFEWDAGKAKSNSAKHGVMFEDAEAVLADPEADVFHYEVEDDANSTDEDRHITFGSDPDDRRIVLLIVWTDRSVRKTRVTRIISARTATGKERRDYGKKISGR